MAIEKASVSASGCEALHNNGNYRTLWPIFNWIMKYRSSSNIHRTLGYETNMCLNSETLIKIFM